MNRIHKHWLEAPPLSSHTAVSPDWVGWPWPACLYSLVSLRTSWSWSIRFYYFFTLLSCTMSFTYSTSKYLLYKPLNYFSQIIAVIMLQLSTEKRFFSYGDVIYLVLQIKASSPHYQDHIHLYTFWIKTFILNFWQDKIILLKSQAVIYFLSMTIVFYQDYTSYPEFKKRKGNLWNSRPQLQQLPIWTEDPTMMLASVLGSGPRAGLCSGPSWGPHSRSGPAPPRLLT